MSRPKTGLERPKPFLVHLSSEETELLARRAFQMGVSKAELLRGTYFRGNTSVKLADLRKKQKNIPVEKLVRKK